MPDSSPHLLWSAWSKADREDNALNGNVVRFTAVKPAGTSEIIVKAAGKLFLSVILLAILRFWGSVFVAAQLLNFRIRNLKYVIHRSRSNKLWNQNSPVTFQSLNFFSCSQWGNRFFGRSKRFEVYTLYYEKDRDNGFILIYKWTDKQVSPIPSYYVKIIWLKYYLYCIYLLYHLQ